MMKNAIKKHWQVYIKVCLFFLFLAQVFTSVSGQKIERDFTCPEPNVSITGQTASSFSFSWDAISGAIGYQVWYNRKEDNYSSSVLSTGNTYITVSGLSPGTYKFYFTTVCGAEASGYIIVDDLVMM